MFFLSFKKKIKKVAFLGQTCKLQFIVVLVSKKLDLFNNFTKKRFPVLMSSNSNEEVIISHLCCC